MLLEALYCEELERAILGHHCQELHPQTIGAEVYHGSVVAVEFWALGKISLET